MKRLITLQILDGTIYNIFEISTKLAAILDFNFFVFCFVSPITNYLSAMFKYNSAMLL